MNGAGELPGWAAVLTALLLLVGAILTLIGSFGLVRLGSFYERVHAPTLGTTMGTASIALASMVYFSALHTRPVLHEILIVVFAIVTTPISLMILVRAAMFRDRLDEARNLSSGGHGKNIDGDRFQDVFGDAPQ
jgi:multicomponent K+:H+ antiporter subunit G